MEEQQALSDLEIVGIAVAAAAALGGLVIGLSRGQDRATDDHPARRATRSLPQADSLTERARMGLEQLREQYPAIREAAREPLDRSREVVGRVETGKLRKKKSKTTDRLAAVASGAGPVLGSGLSKLLNAAQEKLQAMEVEPDKIRDRAREGAQDRGGQVWTEIEKNIAPAARERSQELLERAREALEDVRSSDRDPRGRIDAVAERGQSAASSVARSSTNAVKETTATVIWLSIASGLIYVLLLSPERREQVKQFLCGAYEQGRLLALDFRGYEPEM